jgi:hypothetical protein
MTLLKHEKKFTENLKDLCIKKDEIIKSGLSSAYDFNPTSYQETSFHHTSHTRNQSDNQVSLLADKIL